MCGRHYFTWLASIVVLGGCSDGHPTAVRESQPRHSVHVPAASSLVPTNQNAGASQAPTVFGSSVAAPAEITGKVVSVADGDTITVLDAGNARHTVRLEGIDAPESHQAYGTRCQQELAKRVVQKPVRVVTTGEDKYGRTLGHVFVFGLWVNYDLIQSGYAWHYKEYNSEPELAQAEVRARTAKAGLWSSKGPIPPWQFRHDAEAAAAAMVVSSPAPSAVAPASVSMQPVGPTVYASDRSTRFHSADCRYKAPSARAMPLEEARRRYAPCAICNPAVGAEIPQARVTRQVAPQPPPPNAVEEVPDVTVYITRTGSKYHSAGCRHLAKSAYPISLADAKRRYGACSVCDPP